MFRAFHVVTQALLAVVKGSGGKSRLSKKVLQRAILMFYAQHRLFPVGVVAELPCVQDWSLKHALALKRLVPWFRATYGNRFCDCPQTKKIIQGAKNQNEIACVCGAIYIYIYTYPYIYIIYVHIYIHMYIYKYGRGVLWAPNCLHFWHFISAKDTKPCSFQNQTLLLCNKSNHCAFSTALPMSFIDTLFQPKQTWIIDKNNKTNKCKCLSKECSIALKMYRLYISTGVSLNICNSSFGHVHSKQVPIYAICSL